MPRWKKGTTDHDGDGKMGGSNPKEHDMAKAPTKAAKKPAAKTEPTIKADGQNQMNTAAAEQAEAVQEARGSKSTAESGQAPGPSPKEERAKLNAQFEKADEEARQALIDETQVGLQVRGY